MSERYSVERELGRGGMATVYLARDLRHERLVALKVLDPELAESLSRERFVREIRTVAQLHHPHILPLYDSGESEGLLFYVMPYVEGKSLRARLDRERQLPVEDALRIAREVADALDYAHRRNVVHRDVKPENILLEEGHALVADFGVARAIRVAAELDLTAGAGSTLATQGHLTAIGAAVGTPIYMSPEQASGEAELDGRSDVYSLACVLYEMLAGEPPFTGVNAQAVIAKRSAGQPLSVRVVRPSVPLALEAVIATALEAVPADRFPTARAFADALAAATSRDAAARSSPPFGAPVVTERPSVAVLPFVNVSADHETEYFSDGITDEIRNALSQVPGLRVAARTSCFAFKGRNADVREAGERLRVGTVLEGSVRRAGSRIRITAQLVNTGDGFQIWSQTYERTFEDIFAVQDEIARAIATALTRAAGLSSAALVRPPTDDLEAYSLCLRGQYFAYQRTIEGLRAGLGYFEQAIARDPAYASAHLGVAACWALRGFEEYGDLPPIDALPRARAAAERALSLDPQSAEAHRWLGVVAAFYSWDWSCAESYLQHSLRLAPEQPVTYLWYGMLLSIMRRHGEAVQMAQRALALDPVSLTCHICLARDLDYAGRYSEAFNQLRATLEMEPRLGLAHVWMARVLCNQGKHEEAVEESERAIGLMGRSPVALGVAGYAYARTGRREQALQALADLRRARAGRYVSAVFDAAILAGLGELDQAFAAYEVAYMQRSSWLAFAAVEPSGDYPPRSDPRFTAMLRRLRLDG